MALKKAAITESKDTGAPVTEAAPTIELQAVTEQVPAIELQAVTEAAPAIELQAVTEQVPAAEAPVVTEELAVTEQVPAAEVTEVVPVTETSQVEELAPVTEVQATHSSVMVMVENLRDSYFQQPSTGIRIQGREVKEMKSDGWLEGQIDAKLLKLV
jgi:hypothetical protein